MRPKTLFMALTLALLARPALGDTLRQTLEQNGVAAQGLDAARLDQKITSFAVLNDAAVFCIAYYVDDGSNLLGDTLSLALYDKSGRVWVKRDLDVRNLTIDEQPVGAGSVLAIEHSSDYFYLDTHLTPSASSTLVLSRDLKFHDAVYGWPVGLFADGTMVYEHSEVHFAPTHYTEVSIYDPARRRHWQIYPPQPYQAVRREHMARVKAAYEKLGEDWFRDHNHPMGPELFNNHLIGPVVLDDRAHALIFEVAYDNTDTWSAEEKLKLQSFRSLREPFASWDSKPPVPDTLFMDLYEECRKSKRLGTENSVLKLLEGERELQAMLRAAFETQRKERENWRQYFDALDARWEDPAVWEELRKIIATPAEFTNVVCIVQNANQEKGAVSRELPRSHLENKFGRLPLDQYLEPARLKEIFAE